MNTWDLRQIGEAVRDVVEATCSIGHSAPGPEVAFFPRFEVDDITLAERLILELRTAGFELVSSGG